ncbi:MAG: hypothetical protein H6741_23360 [Alphaproteobacteria bacterium]|nr:hypothetical protein [Alphaproteobacteria bacterium]MCB9795647.1 hypothetical protein [Alphaproteobacteria bacterium]
MCKNAFAALEMPEAPALDPFTQWFGVRFLDLTTTSPNKVDPLAGQPYLGARCQPRRPTPPREERPPGRTGAAAVDLCTWMMGPPPRCR